MAKQETLGNALDSIVEQAGTLYSLPAVAMEVLQLTENPKVDVAALRRCIERDPALVGKLLKTVNSSVFGLGRSVTDLSQAVALLGIKPLKLLVLGFSLPPNLLAGLEGDALAAYWRHTLYKAVAARQLWQTIHQSAGDDAFLAGLLQDIGLLVLLQQLGEPFAKFLARTNEEQADLLQAETDALGFDHRIISARLLTRWGMPPDFCHALALSPTSESAHKLATPFCQLPRILHLAERLAQLVVDERIGLLKPLLAAVAESPGWSEHELDGITEEIHEKVGELAGVLNVSLGEDQSVSEILARAHARLAAAAEDAAGDLAAGRRLPAWQETESLVEALHDFQSNKSPAPPRSACSGVAVAVTITPSTDIGSHSTRVARATSTPTVAAEPGLLGQIAAAVGVSRRRRQPLSLMLIELDDFAELVFCHGLREANGIFETARKLIVQLGDGTGQVITAGEAQLAVLLLDHERNAAVLTARQFCRGLQQSVRSSASVGISTVALPAKNFPAEDLLEAAQRCLYGVQASGGNGVKSIDIY